MEPDSFHGRVAIACGGTGGHLFPGLAIAEEIAEAGGEAILWVSTKSVDQRILRSYPHFPFYSLPSIGWVRGRRLHFFSRLLFSLAQARRQFLRERPDAVLAMGGFTSLAPVWIGKWLGAWTFLHESNSIPGKANRWLAHWVDEAFVGFPETLFTLNHPRVTVTGTPVRPAFQSQEAGASRMALGLVPEHPVLLTMGGSQGARAINDLVFQALPLLRLRWPHLQYLHLSGEEDYQKARLAYAAWGLRALVMPFLSEMELALSAASVAVCRAGASTLAELAAVPAPALVIPYPWATDRHQFFNAQALADTGAVRCIDQNEATPERFLSEMELLLEDQNLQSSMKRALGQWHRPHAAERMVRRMKRYIEWSSRTLRQHGRETAPAPSAALAQEGSSFRPKRLLAD